MDHYLFECQMCECKVAQTMAYENDVFFNCNTCPFADCYEPETREIYLLGDADRKEQIQRREEQERLQRMRRQEYESTPYFIKMSLEADAIREKLKSGVALPPEEFASALTFVRNHEYDVALSIDQIVKYQLSALGYGDAAATLSDYIQELKEDW